MRQLWQFLILAGSALFVGGVLGSLVGMAPSPWNRVGMVACWAAATLLIFGYLLLPREGRGGTRTVVRGKGHPPPAEVAHQNGATVPLRDVGGDRAADAAASLASAPWEELPEEEQP